MKRTTVVAVLAAGVLVVAVVLSLNAVRQEREYRRLIDVGEAALASDQTFEAIEAFSGALAFKRDSMLAYLKRGDTYRQRGELKAALRDLREAANLDPSAPRPLELLGDVNMAMGRYQRAAEHYRSVVALDDRAPRVLYKLGVAYYRNGQSTLAADPLRRAIAIDDRLAEAHYLLGVCLRERKQNTDALRSLNRAVELNPAFATAREELADFYRSLGRQRQWIEQLEALAALEPSRPERLISVALAYEDLGREEATILTLARAGERFPDDPAVSTAVGRVWLARAEGDKDGLAASKAVTALATPAARPTASSETLGLYGEALMLSGNAEEAERTLQRALTRTPVYSPALFHLASVAERRRHLTASRDALIQYSAMVDPQNDAALATRIADLFLRLRDVPSASRWAQRAVDGATSDARSLGLLADVQFRLGRRDAARQLLSQALSRDPQNPTLLRLRQRIGI